MPEISINKEDLYWVKVTNGICENLDSVQIKFLEYPIVQLPDEISTCEETAVIHLPSNPYYNYSWSTGDTSSILELTSSGIYSVTVTNGNCAIELSTQLNLKGIHQFMMPEYNFTVIDSIKSIANLMATGENVTTWEWKFGDGNEVISDRETITHHYLPGFFKGKVIGKNEWGCSAELEFTVDVPYIEFIPNIITPNDDNKNDVFRIIYNGDQSLFGLSVYNRWGNLMFSTSDIFNNWSAINAPTGTYYYVVNLGGNLKKGWLQVMK